ncbi:ankyrin repeat domain-containing protein [Parvibaculum sp.]|uniref:ankyrin repeat domain-containing protein n=1 Tax=Parvibaculum sp. TaxID=2024848 RepID=UPI003919C887
MTRSAAAAVAAVILSLPFCAPASAFQPGGPSSYVIDNETVYAARTGNDEALKVELIKGVSPNETGRDRIPMLLLAAANGHRSTVALLLEYGADPNRRAPDGSTPLTVVSLSGRADIAELLLQAGADPNRPGANRDLPIFIATRARQLSIVDALIRHGVDIHVTDMTGRSALELAEEAHFNEIAALLRAAGG